jgi:Rrf2 family protein
MNTNQRFAVSVHILTLLAASDGLLTSAAIAESVVTNPVVIRRTLASLRERGLVRSRPGVNGGWRLLRAPGKIGLCEVYRSLEQEGVLAMHSHPNKKCRVGAHIRDSLNEVFTAAQMEMEKELGKYTVADILEDVLARAEK